jgi:hypothetical protein
VSNTFSDSQNPSRYTLDFTQLLTMRCKPLRERLALRVDKKRSDESNSSHS